MARVRRGASGVNRGDDAVVALADGTLFRGKALGARGQARGEVVFNTSMTGYQEILTDPSYSGQIVTMTYPEIGNYGVNPDDPESRRVFAAGLIVRALSPVVSNYRGSQDLESYLVDHGVVGIQQVDTRALVRHIREAGAQPGCILSPAPSDEEARRIARDVPSLVGVDLVEGVTTPGPYQWIEPLRALHAEDPLAVLETPERPYRVVAYDFGVKNNILRHLVRRGCEVIVVPAYTTAEEALAWKPEGIFLSNGPGDPDAVRGVPAEVKKLLGRLPIFGICLGHQILALAMGARTFKLKFGHRGANHPVRHEQTRAVEITSQNHGFAVDPASLPESARVTHIHLNDQTVAGFASEALDCYSVQYHPEASPGPHDAQYLFGPFVEMMEARRARALGDSGQASALSP
ncbi:MAG: glutamine-hydrolyzing carbamoyl-phosphate synthase small subunit [Deltaproteobacteria bacterium]|nr:glutamine-hydrolyzing carbamoyl-phosphate synthase small subunit [Deltaproteobacteria bacterium]MCB9788285.1 glutamine-hydrolyzing carbamoyl-phosphate synthase small subunit [Deltaproteobacteria bacterium]